MKSFRAKDGSDEPPLRLCSRLDGTSSADVRGIVARRQRKRLQRRHHPCRYTGAGEHADYENSRARNDARRPNGQQFGPPQASRTGSLCTDPTIATPVPIASASKTKIAAMIFMVSPLKA
jgi:hypothetical protein